MKYLISFLTVLLFANNINGQKKMNEWDYNDSTEYVMIPKMVNDTVSITSFANEFIEKNKIARTSILAEYEDTKDFIDHLTDKFTPNQIERYSVVVEKMRSLYIALGTFI